MQIGRPSILCVARPDTLTVVWKKNFNEDNCITEVVVISIAWSEKSKQQINLFKKGKKHQITP